MAESTIYRYEVSVDDRWHTIELTGAVLHVAASKPELVEFWAEAHVGEPITYEFRVFGTGQSISYGSGRHMGTALAADGRLVRHLYRRSYTTSDGGGGEAGGD